MSIKMFSELPEYIAELVLDKIRFISTLKSTQLTNPFIHSKNLLMIKYVYDLKPDDVDVTTAF